MFTIKALHIPQGIDVRRLGHTVQTTYSNMEEASQPSMAQNTNKLLQYRVNCSVQHHIAMLSSYVATADNRTAPSSRDAHVTLV